MTTLVGTQKEFSDALISLLELEYDANAAYATAIEKLENETYKSRMIEFKIDHDRHLSELITLLKAHQIVPPSGPDMKVILAKGKVVLGSLVGDTTILKAMQTNEMDTNSAYERLNKHDGIWQDAISILQKGLSDEVRHKAWLEKVINK